jgi:hypothetical protein
MSRKRPAEEMYGDDLRANQMRRLDSEQTANVTIAGDDEAARLNDYLAQIINGQTDDSLSPEQEAAQQQQALTNLTNAIQAIIAKKEESQRRRQELKTMEETEAMRQLEAEEIARENMEMVKKITDLLASAQAVMPRKDRQLLTKKLMTAIEDTIDSVQHVNDLTVWKGYAKQLFNELIAYYTEMSAYTYDKSPEVLAKIGSVLAGSVIIGGTVYAASNANTNGVILLELSKYLTTTGATASGLYFFKMGGIPVKEILEDVGKNTLQCVKTSCKAATNELNKLWSLGLDTLNSYLTKKDYQQLAIEWDSASESLHFSSSSESSSSSSSSSSLKPSSSSSSSSSLSPFHSSSSSSSSVKSAKLAIENILNVPENQQQILLLENGVPSEINVGSPNNMAYSQLTDDYDSDNTLGGKRTRKARKNMKKGRKTKKARKTLRKRRHVKKSKPKKGKTSKK